MAFAIRATERPGSSLVEIIKAIFDLTNLQIDSAILIQRGQAFLKSDAVLEIARKLGTAWPILFFYLTSSMILARVIAITFLGAPPVVGGQADLRARFLD